MELWDIYDIDRVRTAAWPSEANRRPKGDWGKASTTWWCTSASLTARTAFAAAAPEGQGGLPQPLGRLGGGQRPGRGNKRRCRLRELREELGLVHDFTKERPFWTTHFERGFDDWYFIRMEADISDLRLQPEEVQDAQVGGPCRDRADAGQRGDSPLLP